MVSDLLAHISDQSVAEDQEYSTCRRLVKEINMFGVKYNTIFQQPFADWKKTFSVIIMSMSIYSITSKILAQTPETKLKYQIALLNNFVLW